MADRCPLCGKRTVNGRCTECGYEIPDEKSISALYNYDPSDDRFGEAYTDNTQDSNLSEYADTAAPRAKPEIKRPNENNAPMNPYAGFNPAQSAGSGSEEPQSASDKKSFYVILAVIVLITLFSPILGIFSAVISSRIFKQLSKKERSTVICIVIAAILLRSKISSYFS